VPGVRDDELGYRERECTLDEEGDRTAANSLGREVVAVSGEAGNARKEGSGGDAVGVVREVRDVDGRDVDRSERPDGLAQSRKLDGARFYQRASRPRPTSGCEIMAICTVFSHSCSDLARTRPVH
jgi:hypothetical protein